jgi:methylase of polypeptide subunit release factors
MTLTEEQQNQVKMQLKKHDRQNTEAKIILDEKTGASLTLRIERDVFGSDIMSSGIYLARFLYKNKNLYKGKTCLDVGCGAGTQGLIMAREAKEVFLSDVSPKAVRNAEDNVKKLKVKNAEVFESDLFASIPKNKKFDVIVFNHPFFPEDAEKFEHEKHDIELRKTMLGGTGLVKRFFSSAVKHLTNGGIIIMPYFHFAGKENDPATHLAKYGFKIASIEKIKSEQGLQLGEFSIYVIKIKTLYT